jgi:hypothetical protein
MRRLVISSTLVFALALAGAVAYGQRTSGPVVEVFKTATCGCCALWVDHLEQNGFTTKVTNATNLTAIKRQHQVPAALESCHTAVVGGYVVEGHVPAGDIQRLLQEKPAIAGIAVPGMPVGSPGMEQGSRRDPYQVVAFTKDGSTRTFASHGR